MDGRDIALLAVAGYVAVMALVRLMARRRDQLHEEFRHWAQAEKRKQQSAETQRRGGRSEAA